MSGLVEYLVRGSVFLLGVSFIVVALRRSSASQRAVWIDGAWIALLLMPAIMLWLPDWPVFGANKGPRPELSVDASVYVNATPAPMPVHEPVGNATVEVLEAKETEPSWGVFEWSLTLYGLGVFVAVVLWELAEWSVGRFTPYSAQGDLDDTMIDMLLGAIGGLVAVLVAAFRSR